MTDLLVRINLDEHEARLVISDALAEYRTHRGPTPQAYVDRRYPADSDYSESFRDNKVYTTGRRTRAAAFARVRSRPYYMVVRPAPEGFEPVSGFLDTQKEAEDFACDHTLDPDLLQVVPVFVPH
ncbi:MAG: hypothetical protein CMH39_00595 [Micrococcales bacterium]|nr:hypothetical protein [Micrococcales bacterium]